MARAYSQRPSAFLSLPPDSWEALGVDTIAYFAGMNERASAEATLIDEWRAATGGKGMIPPIIMTRDTRAI